MSMPPAPERFMVRRAGVRLDRLVADAVDCGRRTARAWIRDGRVLVDGRRASASFRPEPEATVSIVASGDSQEPWCEQAGLVELWDDEELLVLAKPAGLHSHRGASPGSVAAILAARLPYSYDVGPSRERGIAHRLDRDTSGVLLVGRTPRAYSDLRTGFRRHEFEKRYLAIVDGTVAHSFEVAVPLARRRTRVVAARRKDRALAALSRIEPLETNEAWSLVSVTTRTGVAHQVRAHLAMVGHPLVGDAKYGGPPAPPASRRGQLLHAQSIVVGERSFAAPAPEDFLRALAAFRRDDVG